MRRPELDIRSLLDALGIDAHDHLMRVEVVRIPVRIIRKGVIAPGIGISADALFSRAAKLPRVEVAKPPRVVGRNTIHSMQSGIVFGYVGLVDGMVDRIVSRLEMREQLGLMLQLLGSKPKPEQPAAQ